MIQNIPRQKIIIACAEVLCRKVLRENGEDRAQYIKLKHKHTPLETLLICAECWKSQAVKIEYYKRWQKSKR